MTRQLIRPLEVLLLADWRFAFDAEDHGENSGWMSGSYEDRAWERVAVPHSWNAAEEHAGHEGIAWYRLRFACPPQADASHVRLRFEAVFYLARVWLNGQLLGEHEGGYTPFEFDISSLLQPGGNCLAVRVDNRRSTDRLPAHLFEGRSYGWNTYGGIVRDVKLLVTSPVYIGSVRVVARPHLTGYDEADYAAVSAEASVRNASSEGFNGTVQQEIVEDASGRLVAAARCAVEVPPLTAQSVALDVEFREPLLWHFDHPQLYRCITTLLDSSGTELHHLVSLFGVREIDWKNGQLSLNGEPVRLVGLSRHADVAGYGLAETASIMAADFDDLKRLNMVIGRPVHYPQHEFIYDYCDRHGILLSPELPAAQLTAGQLADEHMRALARQQLSEMVTAAANHPCIWAWSVGNEIESDTVAGRAYVKDMAAFVKSLDPTRPVSFASYHLLVGRPWADATQHSDFVMMNEYFGTWHGPKDSLGPALETIRQTWPRKVLVVSEFGFAGHWQRVEGPSSIDVSQYYCIPENADADSEEADGERQRLIREQMAVFRTKPFVSAALFWAYRGGMGVVDDNGRPRRSWHVLREEFAPADIADVEFRPKEPDCCVAHVTLRARGPMEQQIPAYTLRNYRLAWELAPPAGDGPRLKGEMELPILSPGTAFVAHIEIPSSVQGSRLQLSILRPTGFSVMEREFVAP